MDYLAFDISILLPILLQRLRYAIAFVQKPLHDQAHLALPVVLFYDWLMLVDNHSNAFEEGRQSSNEIEW